MSKYINKIVDYKKINTIEHYIAKCEPLTLTQYVPSPKPWALTWNFSPVSPVIINSILLGRLSSRFWSMPVRICVHSDTEATLRSATDIRKEGMVHSCRSNSSQKCSLVLKSGLRPLYFFHSNLGKSFFHVHKAL